MIASVPRPGSGPLLSSLGDCMLPCAGHGRLLPKTSSKSGEQLQLFTRPPGSCASKAGRSRSRLFRPSWHKQRLQPSSRTSVLYIRLSAPYPEHRANSSLASVTHEGRLLSKAAEAQALVDQGRLTYSLYPDLQLTSNMSDSFEVTDEELVAQLRAAKPGKAVPPHIAPAACWRLCADLVGPCLGTAMREHFRKGCPGLLHGDLTDATMAMLPKPGKPEHLLANLRPIGLMAPTSKSLAGILRNRMLEWQLPHLVVRPQFAYVPNRGTMDALLRIHKHLADAARLIRSNRVDRFGQHSGRKPLAFTGALSFSLDLSRAFDLTDRPCLFRALRDYQIPQAVVEVAQRLHFGARFMYKAGDYQAHFTPTNGLKQGCRLAPCLWVWYTLTLMDTLESRLPQGWIDNVLTLFADDCWGSWLLHSLSDLRKALSELAILLCTLEDYKMQINYSKTAVLLKFVGKHAKQALHEITVMKNGVRHLRLVVHDVERLIPIKDSHEYLGTKVTYDGPPRGQPHTSFAMWPAQISNDTEGPHRTSCYHPGASNAPLERMCTHQPSLLAPGGRPERTAPAEIGNPNPQAPTCHSQVACTQNPCQQCRNLATLPGGTTGTSDPSGSHLPSHKA